MPKLTTNVPKLCRHVRGHAFVKVDGRQVWLGRHGDPLTQEKYDRLVAQWLANGRSLPLPPAATDASPTTVLQILAPYWRWVKERYHGGEFDNHKAVLRIVERLYGSSAAMAFGPNALRAVRADMVAKGWTRKHVNRQVSRSRGFFKWAAGHELLPESVYNQLRTVEPLRRGEAAERPRVKPVPRSLIRAVRRRVTRPVRALIDLQLLTAARADELTGLRATDLDRRRPIWAYNPAEHKTAHHDKERWIYFGPRAQRILKLFMTSDRPVDAYLFSPREAERARHAQAAVHRRPNQRPNAKKTGRVVGARYSTASYRRAIHRALADVFQPPGNLPREQLEVWWRKHTCRRRRTSNAAVVHVAPSQPERQVAGRDELCRPGIRRVGIPIWTLSVPTRCALFPRQSRATRA
jgi:integrase